MLKMQPARMKLSDYCRGKDNNFNIIRIFAALTVLITHSFAIVNGSGQAEPFREFLGGMTLGGVAVDVFFIASGFLVTASLLKRQSSTDFVLARTLRILPALLLSVFLTVFVLGVFFTTLPLLSYFSDKHTYSYIAKCSTLMFGVAWTLPGVFDGNPYKNAVNGSLWSMTPEVRLYAILAITWLLLKVAKDFRLKYFKVAVVTSAAISAIYWLAVRNSAPVEGYFPKLLLMFSTGAAFFILKEYITIHHKYFWPCAAALLIATVTGNKSAFDIIYPFTIAYILFYLAYVPGGFIRNYNRLGDYSYGIYIYAFPIQQTVEALQPGISVINMILISGTATIIFSVASWHLLEKRMLGLKGHYAGHTRRLLSLIFSSASNRTR